MKIQLRLDKATIQTFLLENVEKIVFGLLAIVFVLLVYSAWGVERFQKTTDQLSQAVAMGEKTIADTQPDASLTVKDYVDLAKQSRTVVVEDSYVTKTPWDQPLFKKREGRSCPELFAVKEIRGKAAMGAFQMATDSAEPDDRVGSASAQAETRGQRWVVLTALVPIKKQNEAYAELMNAGPAGSYDPAKDTPQYSGYIIQRLEVGSPADAQKPDWKKAKTIYSAKAVSEALKQWGQQTPSTTDVVEAKFIFNPLVSRGLGSPLVFPLGPLVNPWDTDESVAHAEDIPLQSSSASAMGMHATPPAVKPKTPQDGAGEGAAPAEDEFGAKPVAPGSDHAATPSAGNLDPTAPPTYFLFRFFDFNVEPGKHYIYRVQLGLENPNYRRPVAQLKNQDSKLAESQYIKTVWSDPSPVISVPRSTRILAGAVKPGREPSAKIDVVKWSRQRGIETFQEFSVVRGQVVNFPNEKVTPPAGVVPMMTGTAAGQMPASPVGSGDPFLVNYFTHAVALDFRGGERLRGRRSGSLGLPAGGDVLLLDSDGNLMVRDEFEDEPSRQQFRSAQTDQAAIERPADTAPAKRDGGALEKMFRDDTPKGRRPPTR